MGVHLNYILNSEEITRIDVEHFFKLCRCPEYKGYTGLDEQHLFFVKVLHNKKIREKFFKALAMPLDSFKFNAMVVLLHAFWLHSVQIKQIIVLRKIFKKTLVIHAVMKALQSKEHNCVNFAFSATIFIGQSFPNKIQEFKSEWIQSFQKLHENGIGKENWKFYHNIIIALCDVDPERILFQNDVQKMANLMKYEEGSYEYCVYASYLYPEIVNIGRRKYKTDACHKCGKNDDVDNLMTCNGCFSVKYCSRKHQKQHWKKHKKFCKKIQAIIQEQKQEEENENLLK